MANFGSYPVYWDAVSTNGTWYNTPQAWWYSSNIGHPATPLPHLPKSVPSALKPTPDQVELVW